MRKTLKRILTLLLVVCSVVTLLPEAFFVSAASESIYFDSLQNGQSVDWMGGQSSGITTTFENGLQILCISDTVSHEIAKYVEKFANVPEIKVSADVSMIETSNSKERKIGVRARWTTTGDCYEYALCYESGDMFLQLRRIVDDEKNELARYEASAVAELIGADDLYMGTQYTLSMECAGNLIFLYVNGELLDVYWDNSEYAITSGARAGYRAVNTSGSVANFQVEKVAARTIESAEIAELDDTLKLYQGFEISPYEYTINVNFSDGLVYHLPINASMIAEYDNITPGLRSVPIACLGTVVYMQVEIVERLDFIKEFISKVENCAEATTLTLDDKKYIDEMKETYHSLSGYEAGTIDEKVMEKYQQVVDALYRLEHSELAEVNTVYVNDFNGTIEETEWSGKAGDSSGTWRTFNSILVNEHERYGFTNRISYLENTGFYGEVNSVEADVMLTSQDECYAALLSCIGEEGYYHARIRYNPQGSLLSRFTIQLVKNVSGTNTVLESINPSRKLKFMQLNTWYNLRMTSFNGKLAIYLDDVLMIEYDDTNSDGYYTEGTFGFRSNYGDMRYDSLRVMGTELEHEEYVPQMETTYYEDGFEDETQGSNPSHWIEETDSDAWKVYKKADRLVYGTESKEYTYTWLHTFESDPEVSMDFMVENAATDGRIEFLTRYTQEKYAYAGIGYDFSQSKWYVYTSRGMDFEPQTVYAEQTFELTAGTWHTIKIEEDDIHIKVYVDDKLVIEDKNAYTTSYGRVGVLSDKANLYIDNFSYTMPHGGNVSDGVIEYALDWDEFGTMSCMEIESLGGNTLIGLYGNKKFISYDMGMTWEQVTGEYTDVMGKGSYQNLMRVSEGVYLMVYCDDFTVYKSTDYMKTWTKIGQIVSDLDGNSIGITHLNTMTKLTLKNGTERIFFPIGVRRQSESGSTNGHYTRVFYSDDGGATWKESENDTRDVVPAYTEDTSVFSSWTESKITIDSDGVLRLFNSRNYGCVVYTESYDGGETWEGFYSLPYLQNGQSSHTIAQDPEEPNTYYMVCINDKTKFINDVLPRTRHTLVKSTDGGKTWEFVMDLERFKEYENYQSSALYQMLDPSIVIVDGYIIISFGRAYAYDENSAHNKLALRFLRLEMDKLPQTTEWNDATLADSTRPKKLELQNVPSVLEVGEEYSLENAVIKVTAFNGTVTYEQLENFLQITDTPTTEQAGVYTLSFMNKYGQYASCTIKVVDEGERKDWLFTEDFAGSEEDLVNMGWSSDGLTYFSLEKDQMTDNVELISNYTNSEDGTEKLCNTQPLCLVQNKEALSWSNYTYEAEVCLTDTEVVGTQLVGRRAGLLVAVDPETDSWYEFRLIRYTDGKKFRWELAKRTNSKNQTVAYDSYTFDFNKSYNLKVVLNNNVLTCYIDDIEVHTYPATDTDTIQGSIGLYAAGQVARFDSLCVYTEASELKEQRYEVAAYRQGCVDENGAYVYRHPFREGYVFGGWYEDANYQVPLNEEVTEGRAFAKWVDAEVLTVKAQLDANTTADSPTTTMRFVTTVDSFDYENVFFMINGRKYGHSTTVYTKIKGQGAMQDFEYTPDVFSQKSIRFAAVTLHSIPLYQDTNGNGVKDAEEIDNTNTAIIVIPCWTTADGTIVEGIIRNDITIQKGIKAKR